MLGRFGISSARFSVTAEPPTAAPVTPLPLPPLSAAEHRCRQAMPAHASSVMSCPLVLNSGTESMHDTLNSNADCPHVQTWRRRSHCLTQPTTAAAHAAHPVQLCTLPACSACRAVWYCGTACSHADWREGGHRRVCRALGIARQKAKEAAAAAAGAADVAAGQQ